MALLSEPNRPHLQRGGQATTLCQGTLTGDRLYPAFDLRLLHRYVVQQLGAAEGQALLQSLTLHPDELDHRPFIFAWQMLAALAWASNRLPGPAAGIRFGLIFRPTDLDLLLPKFAQCRDLAELYELTKQEPALMGWLTDHIERFEADHLCVRCLNVGAIEPAALLFLFEHSVASMLTIARHCCGGSVRLERVCFASPCPGPEAVALYERLLGCAVQFDCDYFEWRLAREQLSAPVNADLTSESLGLFERPEQASLIDRVVAILLRAPHAFPCLEHLAVQLNLSCRTLRRRLRQAGTSYQKIQNMVRCQLALTWLHQQYDIEEISERLGFGDVSNFRHAFKRWLGIPPGQLLDG
ncbi:helix-turn-helix transcriptional regulator [Ferrimonas pelagia]